MHALHLRRIVDEAIAKLSTADDPFLLTHLARFLHGKRRGPLSSSAADVGEGADDNDDEGGVVRVGSSSSSLYLGPDPSIMSCGFIPVALVAEAGVGGGGGEGSSALRFDVAHFIAASKQHQELSSASSLMPSAMTNVTITNTSSIQDLIASFGTVLVAPTTAGMGISMAATATDGGREANITLGGDMSSFASSVMFIVKEKVRRFAALVAEAERSDLMSGWEEERGDGHHQNYNFSSNSFQNSHTNQRRSQSRARHGSVGGPSAHHYHGGIGGGAAFHNHQRSVALRRRRERPILIVCHCGTMDGTHQFHANAGGGGSHHSNAAAAAGSGNTHNNAAAIRRVALAMAQTVTRVVLAAEAAAAAGRALSFAAVGDEECCPLISVLIVSPPDAAAVTPFVTSMVGQHCLGSQLRVFDGHHHNSRADNVKRNHQKGQQGTQKDEGAPKTAPLPPSSSSSSPPSGLPTPLARFLYEVLPHVPVVLPYVGGLERLLAAYYASYRLTDVGAMFIALLYRFGHLRKYVDDQYAAGALLAPPTPAPTASKALAVEKRRAGQKKRGREEEKDFQGRTDGEEGIGPSSSLSLYPTLDGKQRAAQFTANADLLQLLFDHSAVVAFLHHCNKCSMNGEHAATTTATAAATQGKTAAASPPSSSSSPSSSIAAAVAFGTLYAALSKGEWGMLSRVTLWSIDEVFEDEDDDDDDDGVDGVHLDGDATDAGNENHSHDYYAKEKAPQHPSPMTKRFGRLPGRQLVKAFNKNTVVYLDVSHIGGGVGVGVGGLDDPHSSPSSSSSSLPSFQWGPTYFPALCAPRIAFTPELVKALLGSISIVVSGGRGPEEKEEETTEANPRSALSNLDAANALLAGMSSTKRSSAATHHNSLSSSSLTPSMQFSDVFFSSAISDGVRILYVLICHELQASSGGGGSTSSSHVWVPLSHVCLICCFGDELRCLRALHYLTLCRVVTVRPERGDVRSRCLS